MPAAKQHTTATLAAELLVLLPTLTERASQVLTATLLRDVCGYRPSQLIEGNALILTDDRRRVLAKAKRLYL